MLYLNANGFQVQYLTPKQDGRFIEIVGHFGVTGTIGVAPSYLLRQLVSPRILFTYCQIRSVEARRCSLGCSYYSWLSFLRIGNSLLRPEYS